MTSPATNEPSFNNLVRAATLHYCIQDVKIRAQIGFSRPKDAKLLTFTAKMGASVPQGRLRCRSKLGGSRS
jgi:hypothetical protein